MNRNNNLRATTEKTAAASENSYDYVQTRAVPLGQPFEAERLPALRPAEPAPKPETKVHWLWWIVGGAVGFGLGVWAGNRTSNAASRSPVLEWSKCAMAARDLESLRACGGGMANVSADPTDADICAHILEVTTASADLPAEAAAQLAKPEVIEKCRADVAAARAKDPVAFKKWADCVMAATDPKSLKACEALAEALK